MPSVPLEQLARRIGAILVGGRGGEDIRAVAPLAQAGAHEIAVLADPSQLPAAQQSRAAAFLLQRQLEPLERPQLVCRDLRRGLGLLVELLAPPVASRRGVDPRAVVEQGARIDATAYVGPFAFVGSEAHVGPDCQIEPFAYVGCAALLGRGCRVGPHAVVGERCKLEARVVVGPGAVIGHDGFGYWRDGNHWKGIRSVGSVEIGENADLGANCCIDRGTLGATRIEAGVKIDNLVQVGHNAEIGADALVCAQAGLAGSARLGAGVMLAGQVGVADHVTIGSGARVGAASAVLRSVGEQETVTGYPAMEHRQWLRTSVLLGRLDALVSKVRYLDRRLAELEGRALGDAE